jgi:hypothetical protein
MLQDYPDKKEALPIPMRRRNIPYKLGDSWSETEDIKSGKHLLWPHHDDPHQEQAHNARP